MKLITAVIKPHQVEEVKEALALLGVQGMTVTEAQGFGRQGGHTETYRGTEYKVAFTPKSRLEIVVSDDDADKAVDAVLEQLELERSETERSGYQTSIDSSEYEPVKKATKRFNKTACSLCIIDK